MNIISVSVEQGAMVDKKACCEPCLCLLSSRVCLNKANPYLSSALDSVDGGKIHFRQLDYVFMFKIPSPPLQMNSWNMLGVLIL